MILILDLEVLVVEVICLSNRPRALVTWVLCVHLKICLGYANHQRKIEYGKFDARTWNCFYFFYIPDQATKPKFPFFCFFANLTKRMCSQQCNGLVLIKAKLCGKNMIFLACLDSKQFSVTFSKEVHDPLMVQSAAGKAHIIRCVRCGTAILYNHKFVHFKLLMPEHLLDVPIGKWGQSLERRSRRSRNPRWHSRCPCQRQQCQQAPRNRPCFVQDCVKLYASMYINVHLEIRLEYPSSWYNVSSSSTRSSRPKLDGLSKFKQPLQPPVEKISPNILNIWVSNPTNTVVESEPDSSRHVWASDHLPLELGADAGQLWGGQRCHGGEQQWDQEVGQSHSSFCLAEYVWDANNRGNISPSVSSQVRTITKDIECWHLWWHTLYTLYILYKG